MVKVIVDEDGITHLRGNEGFGLCITQAIGEADGVLACGYCAKIALKAIEASTKAERREWRKL